MPKLLVKRSKVSKLAQVRTGSRCERTANQFEVGPPKRT